MKRASKRAMAVMRMIFGSKNEELLRLYGYKLKPNELISHASTSDKFLAICRFSETQIQDGQPYDYIEKRIYIDKRCKKYDEKEYYKIQKSLRG